MLAAATVAAMLSGCVSMAPPDRPQAAFWAALQARCGQAFAGQLVSNDAADADMSGRPLIMHVRECSDSAIHIPFHVGPAATPATATADGAAMADGWDRSRTWIISRTGSGLRLKHDHRHADGTADAVTFYGGDTDRPGTSSTQAFPVDAESIALFEQAGLSRSVTNVWTVEISDVDAPAPRFAYVLRRTGENARHFRVEFDLGRPVAPPPAPWGH